MYKVNGQFNSPLLRKLRKLDFRAPEDRLSVEDDEEQEVRSPGIDRMIEAYYAAGNVGDDSERASALRGMINEMTALHKLRGVPVFAHPPLPPQFVSDILDETDDNLNKNEIVRSVIDAVDPNLRAAVKQQFAMRSRLPMKQSHSLGTVFGVGGGANNDGTRISPLPGSAMQGSVLAQSDDDANTSEIRAPQGHVQRRMRTLEYDPSRDRAPWTKVQAVFDPYEASLNLPLEERKQFLQEVRRASQATASFLGRALYELSPLPQAREFVVDVRAGNYASAALAILMALPAFKGVRIGHHIIAKLAHHHAELRTMMRNFGIDINDTDNLARMMAEVHHVLHTNNYYTYVVERMQKTRNADDVRAALRDIKHLLENLKGRDDARKLFPPASRR